MQQDLAEPFWHWCLRAYARPGVARAALCLQDRCGASVMVLLWLCWRAECGAGADPAQVRGVHERSALIERHALVPLRAARRALAAAAKRTALAGPDAAARRTLAAELGIERLQALRLEAGGSPPDARAGPLPRGASLVIYLELLGARDCRSHRIAHVLARRVSCGAAS